MTPERGLLLVAATPLGNTADASARLAHWLATADIVAAEDTRRTLRLAADLGVTISGRLVSHYDAVETQRSQRLAADVAAGRTVLVVTDAGMPAVSDPGLEAVRRCIAEDLPVTCLPGPSALTTALVLSGLPADRFCFEGFLPRRGPQRRRRLREVVGEQRTMVFFESPRRTSATLSDMAEVFGADRPVAVCRELTKTHEEVLRGTVGDLADRTADLLGEVTLVIGGAAPAAVDLQDLQEVVEHRVAGGVRRSQAVSEVAAEHGVSRRQLYEAVLAARVSPRS